MRVCRADQREISVLSQLAVLLWPDYTREELESMFTNLIENEEAVFFLLYDEEQAVGFSQCQLRHDYVEGTSSTPVGYLEGIYVKEATRSRGGAKALLKECEKWAAAKGCKEFASDCELDNAGSRQFHLAMGFQEANRIICFTKKL